MAHFHCSKARLLTLCGLVAGIATTVCASSAQAGWHWHGSHGGYSSFGSASYGGGSWGSHGGSYGGSHGGSWGGYGSHGSHGGSHGRVGLLHRLHHRHRNWGSHGSSGGSSGGYVSSWGSSGGSSGGFHGGSSGGYSSYGSSGGKVMYGSPVVPDAVVPANPQDPATLPEIKPDANQGALKVQVPEDALVYVNGILTKSVGEQRSYVSRGLMNGFQYTYEVRAEAIRDGKKVEETKTVQLKAGETTSLAFDLNGTQTPETTLTLKVPADAKVSLGGNPTNGSGTVRVFSTTKLNSNNEWSNYVVHVTVERDGRAMTQEKNVTLKAGDNQTLSFDFDSAQVADAR